MIYFKESVRIKRYTPALNRILITLYDLNALLIPNYPSAWYITSINDGKHVKNSKHYQDNAVDMRSKNFDTETRKQEFVDRLKFALGPQFTVLYENAGSPNEHFHIQVKKGTVFL